MTPGVPRYYATARVLRRLCAAGARHDLCRPADQARRQSRASGDKGPQRRVHAGGGAAALRSRPLAGRRCTAAIQTPGPHSSAISPSYGAPGWRAKGEGLRILSATTTSPTLIRQLRELTVAFPECRLHRFEPVGVAQDARRCGSHSAARSTCITDSRIARSSSVLTMICSVPGRIKLSHARAWSSGRGEAKRRIGRGSASTSPKARRA